MSHTKKTFFASYLFDLQTDFNSKTCNRLVMIFVVVGMIAKTMFSHTRMMVVMMFMMMIMTMMIMRMMVMMKLMAGKISFFGSFARYLPGYSGSSWSPAC